MKCKSWPEGEDEEAEVDVDNEAAQAKYGELQGETLTNVISQSELLSSKSTLLSGGLDNEQRGEDEERCARPVVPSWEEPLTLLTRQGVRIVLGGVSCQPGSFTFLIAWIKIIVKRKFPRKKMLIRRNILHNTKIGNIFLHISSLLTSYRALSAHIYHWTCFPGKISPVWRTPGTSWAWAPGSRPSPGWSQPTMRQGQVGRIPPVSSSYRIDQSQGQGSVLRTHVVFT